MIHRGMMKLSPRWIGALLILGLCMPAGESRASASQSGKPQCDTPAALTALQAPLPRVAAKFAAGKPVTVVAIGSSSTAGAGASLPGHSYPAQLARLWPKYLPGLQVTVLNRGRNGEEIPQMLERFEADVANAQPDLVIWQFGTNAILRNNGIAAFAAPLQDGLNRLRTIGADIVLVDLQYAPLVLGDADHQAMQIMIGKAAQQNRIGLFRRFALMKHWVDSGQMVLAQQVGPDGLHHNDFGYLCLAKGLASGLTQATRKALR